jgi:hypothetical protein
MVRTAEGLGKQVLKQSLIDWGTRIAKGEVPPAPPRPTGIERHMVVTQWEWARDDSYIHDNVSTDRRNPSLYPYGKVYGLTLGLGKDTVISTGTNSDSLLVFDPTTEQFTVIRIPYPRGMFTRGLDGRIDDAKAGWRGRGLWASNNTDGLVHTENRRSFISHVQFPAASARALTRALRGSAVQGSRVSPALSLAFDRWNDLDDRRESRGLLSHLGIRIPLRDV